MAHKAQTLKGFRDFLPKDKAIRNYVSQKLVGVFEKYGFLPLETPTLEYSEVLLGKYGNEADKLVYTFEDKGGRKVGLRYDQTVPLARVMGQYQSELPKYFRRYQLQNVFRAEKPQKGRFREFLQCDIDITGSTNILAEAEILACTYDSFKALGFNNIRLLVNDRELLIKTLKPFETQNTDVFSLIQTIDKLDKKSEDEIIKELIDKGLSKETATSSLHSIKEVKISTSLEQIIEATINMGVAKDSLIFEPTLARGLDYYTGIIIEVKTDDYPSGSLAGGGRYDNLIEDLGGPSTPAVGLAFGFDRIIEAMTELNLLSLKAFSTPILLAILDEASQNWALEATSQLRKNLDIEVIPNITDATKQLKYANSVKADKIILVGNNEAEGKKITLKDLESGTQQTLTVEEALNTLQ